jgi:N-acyl-D-aspartate/D-glutamate deacylase
MAEAYGAAAVDEEWWKKQEAKRAAEERRDQMVRKQLEAIQTKHAEEREAEAPDYVTRDEFDAFLDVLKDELRKRLLWRGTWKAGESYQENDLCQDKNTLHVCTATATDARPGTGAGWRQLVRPEVKA